MKCNLILLTAVVGFSAASSALSTSSDKFLRGTASVEIFACTRGATGLHCKATGESLGSQAFVIPSDMTQGRYFNFPISQQRTVSVKITSSTSPNSYFITTGLQGLESGSSKPIFNTGDAIFEVDAKRNAQSVQMYSPEFEQFGSLRLLKATVVFKN